VVEVTAGSAPYAVRLVTTRRPGGEDEATLAAGATATLRSDDVGWGETIDGRLEYTARDGSGTTFVDELDNYSFTRPTAEDCAAVAAPTDPEPSPSASPAPAAETPGGLAQSAGASGTDGPPQDSVDSGPAAVPPVSSGSASADQVAPGGTVTVHGTGFLPGEKVVVQLGEAVLASPTARADGSVHTDIRIPEHTAAGPATVGLVGNDSAVTADVALQVASASTPAGTDGIGTLVALVAAAVALVASAAALVRSGFVLVTRTHPLR
jgi:hypothetical protein